MSNHLEPNLKLMNEVTMSETGHEDKLNDKPKRHWQLT